MNDIQYSFGMIGLGTMGCNLVLNMQDNGFSVAGYDRDTAKVDGLNKLSDGKNVQGFKTITDFVNSLSIPRTIMLLVPAGPVVDAVVTELKPLLSKDDLIIDCGNSHFSDTQVRIDALAKEGLHFMGIGVSGGETGARRGPSIMPGGDKTAYARIAPMLEAVSAKVNGQPCVAYMGNGAAGHYVKMVHNGIEYALMQMIAEAYHLLRSVAGLSNDELNIVFTRWNQGKLGSFLIEITADIFVEADDKKEGRLIDAIADTAHQKGTGAWMSEDAMALPYPIPAIDAAVSQRIISSMKAERVAAAEGRKLLQGHGLAGNKADFINQVEDALHTGFILAYAQGFGMLQQASAKYNYGIDNAIVAAIWRGGCIIRATMLDAIQEAFVQDGNLKNIIITPYFNEILSKESFSLKAVLKQAINNAIPLPALSACNNYYDSYCSGWLPANLIQAQRDLFGAHTYERSDMPGIFHTSWGQQIK